MVKAIAHEVRTFSQFVVFIFYEFESKFDKSHLLTAKMTRAIVLYRHFSEKTALQPSVCVYTMT